MAKRYAVWFSHDKDGKVLFFNGFNPDGSFEKEAVDWKNGKHPTFTCSRYTANKIARMIDSSYQTCPIIQEIKNDQP